jgi:hypothetical protein
MSENGDMDEQQSLLLACQEIRRDMDRQRRDQEIKFQQQAEALQAQAELLANQETTRQLELRQELEQAREDVAQLRAEQDNVHASGVAARVNLRKSKKVAYLLKHKNTGISRTLGFLFDLNYEAEDWFTSFEGILPGLEELLQARGGTGKSGHKT